MFYICCSSSNEVLFKFLFLSEYQLEIYSNDSRFGICYRYVGIHEYELLQVDCPHWLIDLIYTIFARPSLQWSDDDDKNDIHLE